MRKLIFWSMAVCLAFALAPSAPALADDDGVINHGLLGVHPDIQGDVDGILQVTTVHEDDEWGEGGSSSNWVPSWGANPWSSDGEKIVYQSTRIDPISGWQQYEICTMNADGTGWQQLTNNSRCDSHASFVPPNNEKIVFQRNVNQDEGEWGPWDGNGEIWIMDADGSNQVSLTQQHGGPVEEGSCENHPVVSPDGQFIAFRTCGGELWVMGINGELLYPFPVSGELRTHHHIWHPFLPMIVFSGSEGWGDSRIYGVFLGEGGFEPPQEGGDGDIQPLGVEPGEPLPPEIFRISPEEDEIPFESWCENWPSISPDGERLAYHSRYSGLLLQGEGDMEEFPFGDIHAIWVWGDEEAPQPVAIHFEGDGTPWSKIQGPTSWAPDSITLAYVAEQGDGEGDFEPLAVEPVDDGDEGEDEEPPYPQQALFIVDTDSLEKTQLTEGYQDTRPWWSPDGGKILFKENNDWWGGEEISSSRDGDTMPWHMDLLVLFFGGEMPAQNGCLSVTIEPEGARMAGAQWRIAGGNWKNSGAVICELPVGDYTVEFKAVNGWNAPADQELAVIEDQTTESTGTYVRQVGSVLVNIEPLGARNAGAQWRIDGGAWQNSGATVSNLPVGQHAIEFKAVNGWDTPASQDVTVIEDQTAEATGIYVQQVGGATVTILPVEAVNAGAKWRVGGGVWQNSGATVNDLPVGPYVVEFQPVAGWTTPFSKNVTVENGQTASTSGTYVEQGPLAGDVDGDGQLTPSDLRVIRALMGVCVGNRKYIPAADMDSSGCINTADINLWYKAYAAFQAGQQ